MLQDKGTAFFNECIIVIQRLALFIPAPPEHIAHVINSVSLFAGLREAYPDLELVWITMNPRDTNLVLNPALVLDSLGLGEFDQQCNVEVLNCAHLVKDEFSPTFGELEAFIADLNCESLYMHFYPPFWFPVCQICHSLKMSFGLHVKVFHRRDDIPYYFEHAETALNALKQADYLSVSQLQDRVELHQSFSLAPEKMIVLPKSVPQKILEYARTIDSKKKLLQKYPQLKMGIEFPGVCLGYIGRFEELKNIVWFLEECMPDLVDITSAFHLMLVGTGSQNSKIQQLAQAYENVTVINEQLSYQETLHLLTHVDLTLYPSGFDFSPRLPLESLLLGTPCLLADVHFNHRYRSHALMVDAPTDQIGKIGYNDVEIRYALPSRSAVVSAIRKFVETHSDSAAQKSPRSEVLERESNPMYAAHELMCRIHRLAH